MKARKLLAGCVITLGLSRCSLSNVSGYPFAQFERGADIREETPNETDQDESEDVVYQDPRLKARISAAMLAEQARFARNCLCTTRKDRNRK